MRYNKRLDELHAYPFARLKALLDGVCPPADKSRVSLGIGEPQHPALAKVLDVLAHELKEINRYPATAGLPELKEAICDWLTGRYSLSDNLLNTENVLPVVGTREALFAIAQCLVDVEPARVGDPESSYEKPLVLMPSPFYQIYEGAAIMAGAEPRYLPSTEVSGFQPDFTQVDEADWQRCRVLYLCNPSNPTGAVLQIDDYTELLALAVRHDFVICSDECYSEIYPDEDKPTTGLLEAVHRIESEAERRKVLEHCIVFNSLSKRSNLAGMRSGFVAGGAKLLEKFLLYRTYHGSAMPLHHQAASIVAWKDEQHVVENRALYREKMQYAFEKISAVNAFSLVKPKGGFCLWVKVPGCDQAFAKGLYESEHLVVLPGSYLARDVNGENAGCGFIRIAIVQDFETCMAAVERLCRYAESLQNV